MTRLLLALLFLAAPACAQCPPPETPTPGTLERVLSNLFLPQEADAVCCSVGGQDCRTPNTTPGATPCATGTPVAGSSCLGPVGGPANLSWHLATTASATRYGASVNTTTETQAQIRMPSAGRVSNLFVYCPTAPTGGTIVVTLRDAGVSKAVTCTVADGGTECSDVANVYDYAANATLSVQGVNSATNAPVCEVAARVTANGSFAQHDGILAWPMGNTFVSSAGTNYGGPMVYNAIGTVHFATAPAAAWVVSSPCTLTAMTVMANSNLGANSTRAYTLRRQAGSIAGADTDLTGTLSDSISSVADTTCTSNCAVAAGDQLVLRNDETGTTGSRSVAPVIECANWLDIVGAVQRTANAVSYFVPNGATNATQANALQRVPYGGTAQNLRVTIDTAPATTHAYTLCTGSTAAGVSCTGTRPTCTITTAQTACSDLDSAHNLTLTAGDYYTIRGDAQGSGTRYVSYSVQLLP